MGLPPREGSWVERRLFFSGAACGDEAMGLQRGSDAEARRIVEERRAARSRATSRASRPSPPCPNREWGRSGRRPFCLPHTSPTPLAARRRSSRPSSCGNETMPSNTAHLHALSLSTPPYTHTAKKKREEFTHPTAPSHRRRPMRGWSTTPSAAHRTSSTRSGRAPDPSAET